MEMDFLGACKAKLLTKRDELLNFNVNLLSGLKSCNLDGDEIDQTNSLMSENKSLVLQNRNKLLIIEINVALEKLLHNEYGICEYTGQLISKARLSAIPWTRLSIEGAETIEKIRRKFKQVALT